MRKSPIVTLVLAALAAGSQLGCRMCQNCYDYSSPVAGACDGGLHGCRAGSCAAVARQNEERTVVASAEEPAAPTVLR